MLGTFMENPEAILTQIARDQFLNMPAWSFRWVGSYLGIILATQMMAVQMGWKDYCLVDAAHLVRRVFQEIGGTLDYNIRLVDGQGNHQPIAWWEGRII